MLFLNNDDVASLLTIEDCIEVIEDAYKELGGGRAAQFPMEGRMDLGAPSPGPELHRRFGWGAMAGVYPKGEMFALRMKLDIHYQEEQAGGHRTHEKFCVEPGTYCGLVLLASTRTAEPLAIVNDGVIQHLRVGATAGMAAKYLAKAESRVLGMIGSGGMARTYAQAYRAVRPVERIQVYSLTPAHREGYAVEMRERLGVEVAVMNSAEEAAHGADIVADCTDSMTPVFNDSHWVEEGMHITTYGANRIGADVVRRADVVVRHFKGNVSVQVGREKDEEEQLWRQRNPASIRFEEMPLLVDVVAGRIPGRSDDRQVTCFYNVVGSGITFPAVGARLYQRAREREVGRQVPTEWFLQDIRD